MFNLKFEVNDLELIDSLKNFDIDVQRYINWYLSQVYQDLAKKHSRQWTYVTPPGDKRRNIYKRSGKLRSDLSDARYVKKIGENEWEAGFNIRPGSYLHIHAGYRDDPPTTIKSLGNSQMFLGKMAIPLRAALSSGGIPKIMTPRVMNSLLILPFHVLQAGKLDGGKKTGAKPLNDRKNLNDFKRGKVTVDFAGENTSKFHANSLIVCKKSGRKFIPLYVLAKEVKIPKRIFIKESMEDHYDDFYNKLDEAVMKAINGKQRI